MHSECPFPRRGYSRFSPGVLFNDTTGSKLVGSAASWNDGNNVSCTGKWHDLSVSLHVVSIFLTFIAAGIPLEQIAGSNTSVHVGCFTTDFLMQQFREPQQIPKYSATGTASSILSNRLSWFYNLHGPSLTVDTACSSSLVALDLACKGLWEGTSIQYGAAVMRNCKKADRHRQS